MTSARILVIALAGTVLAAGSVRAEVCPPSADLAGDPTLVIAVGEILVHRGMGAAAGACVASSVRLERRGETIVLVRMGSMTEERLVSDPETAATVIESWSRNDFEGPLLGSHLVRAVPVRSPEQPREAPTLEASHSVAARGLQLFGGGEASIANDRTSWLGAVLGVCIQVGRVCVSARGRVAAVVDGPGMWDVQERHAADVLVGGDIPFTLGPATLSVGIGMGMGSVHTGSHVSGMDAGSETSGLRADAHLGWTILLGHRLALDVFGAFDVSQVTDVEGSLSAEATAEPRFFARLGAGLRFGGD